MQDVDSNMKSSNYIKIQFKTLIYFELEQTNLTVFELSVPDLYCQCRVFVKNLIGSATGPQKERNTWNQMQSSGGSILDLRPHSFSTQF